MFIREVTVGRSPTCDIYLDPRCHDASRHHATLYYDGNQLMFRDTSTNGTLINNISVRNRSVPIKRGDIIMLAGRYPLSWNQIDRYYPPQQLTPIASEMKKMTQRSPFQPCTENVEVYKWSWGAFALYPFWGFFNGCWWAFFALLVSWSILPSILFGIYGRRLAWENRKWLSIQDFIDTQKTWDICGLILFAISMIIFFLFSAIYIAAIISIGSAFWN